MEEWEFVREMAERADCLLLLDVNNVLVSGFNHGFDPVGFIESIPVGRVAQLHLAGHSDLGTHRIDRHDQPVCEEVFRLYEITHRRFRDAAATIERDDNFPPLPELLAELDRMRAIAAKVDAERSKSAA